MHLKEMKNIKSHIWLNLLKLTLHNLPRKVSRATEPTLINTCDQLIHLWPKYVGERDMDWERMGITERIGKMEK